ncbi:endonuclease/exonuclease/phosphatase family metal-dependent hydrolase [Pseudomonas duriflava]|uniref:Endonuclease/exonuclease/phosphatase family metal-dependent hydrolase n=1 Tax=Pseudomonas duriflava TaxID=459528 RepID=A0A562Q7R6_9PSED|nr:endonuclease/exonuclease/phosphatase family protein [Pseudomonas duriflava]TWI52744.1 endonuclease/exonuclease/phosphatase family metal-dependent hydrolase [Pseudomonas duriflava]
MTAGVHGFSFKILTINTHKGFTALNRKFILPELRDAVRTVSADLVFLQEVLGTHEKHPLRYENWPAAPQYEFLADSMWTDFAYGRNAVYPDGHHGNAVLSKFPIVTYQNLDVSITGPEKRGLLHCVLRVPDHDVDIHAICVHLGLRENHRLQQLKLMCKLIESLPDDAPLVVAGDFNDWRQRASDVLKNGAGLEEAFLNAHGQHAKTFPARMPMLRLDRIYTRNVTVREPTVLSNQPWSHLSDHAPLAVELCV